MSGKNALAPHVLAAISQAAQPKLTQQAAGPQMAAHVRNAMAGPAQAKKQELSGSRRQVSPHVQMAINAAAQPKAADPLPSPRLPAHVHAAINTRPQTSPSQIAQQPARHTALPQVQAAQDHSNRGIAAHVQQAIANGVQAKIGGGALPITPTRVLQAAGDSDFEVDEELLEELQDEEDDYHSYQAKKKRKTRGRRTGKPKGLLKRKRQALEEASSGDEEEIVKRRRRDYPNSKYKKKPPKLQKSKYRVSCRRCKRPIYFNDKYQELGVIHDNNKRHGAPLGHKVDYSQYQAYLAQVAEKLAKEGMSPGDITDIVKTITWDADNLDYEHYDCNATARKITLKNMTIDQENQGKKYVDKALEKLLGD